MNCTQQKCCINKLYKLEKNGIPKVRPKRQNCRCYRLGVIEPVHGRYWKVQDTFHTPKHQLINKQNFTFIVNFELRNIGRCVHTTVKINHSM
jgi:hypothetical protein